MRIERLPKPAPGKMPGLLRELFLFGAPDSMLLTAVENDFPGS
jgi:hypothetical protein